VEVLFLGIVLNMYNSNRLSSVSASPENGTVLTLTCTTPDWYLDYADAAFISSMTATCTNNGYSLSVILNSQWNPSVIGASFSS